MRIRIVAYLFPAITLASAGVFCAATAHGQLIAKAEGSQKPKKDAKPAAPGLPKQGIKTPGVQIPFASLKAEAEFPLSAEGIAFTDTPLGLGGEKIYRIDVKPSVPAGGESSSAAAKPAAPEKAAEVPSTAKAAADAGGKNSMAAGMPVDEKPAPAEKPADGAKPVTEDKGSTADEPATVDKAAAGEKSAAGTKSATVDGPEATEKPVAGEKPADAKVAGGDRPARQRPAPAGKPPATVAVNKPCGGAITGFGSLWVPSCGDQTLVRLDSQTWKTTATVPSGAGTARPAVAVTADSVWMLSDDKTTLSRIDPDQNTVVAEIRLPGGCNTLTFGETALWATCPSEDRVLRIDPATELVTHRIEVSAQPKSLAIGENSLWVFCQKEGKVERIDPKTNKVIKTIDLGITGATEGSIAIGLGSVWVSMTGFPITRIDPQTDKVVQQFWGAGGGIIQVGVNAIWLSNLNDKTLWRLDPKRIAATLAE